MSYTVFHGDEEIEITCEGFDGLPPERQTQIIELLGEPLRRDEYCICFKKGDSGAVDSAVEILRKYYRNRSATVRRRSNEMQKSMGVYYPSDIRDIYDIQQGKCYFSREPISLENKDYAIDHLTPVNDCGSSWPANLALVAKKINLEKRERNKAQYWKILKEKYGQEWTSQQKKWCAEVDKQRRKIDRERKKSVQEQIDAINLAVWKYFQCTKDEIELSMRPEELVLVVDGAITLFPAGMLRRKRLWKTPDYVISVAASIRGT